MLRRIHASDDLYVPWQRLARQIALSSHVIEGRLSTIEDLIKEHLSVKQAMGLEKVIRDPLSSDYDRTIFYDPIWGIVRAALIAGYNDANTRRGRIPPSGFVDRASRLADERAKEVDQIMRRTTRIGLNKNRENFYLLSPKRAQRAVRYEAATSYNKGLLAGTLGSNLMKSWVTTGDDPCPVCIENEDSDWIDTAELFPSGDPAPLAHINCACVLALQ